MSACSNALRVLSRTRVPAASKTLAPFLYQTVTIQQWKPAGHPIARRNASSRPPNHDDDVPFEDAEPLPPSIDNAESSRQTTITGSERAAFEKLYQTFNTQAPPKSDLPRAPEIDQIADEWYEEDEDKDGEGDADASLDSLFDKVLAGAPAPGKVSNKQPKKRMDDLESLAASILRSETENIKKKPTKDAAAEAKMIKEIRDKERARVTGLMEQAQTDRELWEILEREVLGVIRKLDLDGVKKTLEGQVTAASSSRKDKRRAKSQALESIPTLPKFPTSPTDTPYVGQKTAKLDSRNLFANYPAHLYNAARLLRTNFPSSALPLSILPAIKSVGRSSFALGASTALYNLLIRTAWHQHASYDYIDELLGDMDNAGVEFDLDTLALLDSMLTEYHDARRGMLGWTVKTVWAMEQFGEGAKRLQKWKDVVGQRLGVTLETRAREGKVVRKEAGETPRVRKNPVEGPMAIRKVEAQAGGVVRAIASAEYRLKFDQKEGDGEDGEGERDALKAFRESGGGSALDELINASKMEQERKGGGR